MPFKDHIVHIGQRGQAGRTIGRAHSDHGPACDLLDLGATPVEVARDQPGRHQRMRQMAVAVQRLVNGNTVADYTDPNHAYRKGHIALQANSWEDGDSTVVRFRKIEIKELPTQ